MAVFSRAPREYRLKPHFSENKVANSGYNTKNTEGHKEYEVPEQTICQNTVRKAGGRVSVPTDEGVCPQTPCGGEISHEGAKITKFW